jgi:hypothetical protein
MLGEAAQGRRGMSRPRFQIVLRAEQHRIDPVLRPRALLKRAWRDHALRCVSILQLNNDGASTTMKISTAFPSKYLRASDVDEMGGQLTYTIRKVVMEEVGQDRQEKPVMYFKQVQMGLVLNRTNAARLSASLGDETSAWTDRQIVLETEQVPMRGQLVNSIRVRTEGNFVAERRVPTPQEAQVAAQKPLDDLSDEIPFGWVGALLVPRALALLGAGGAV